MPRKNCTALYVTPFILIGLVVFFFCRDLQIEKHPRTITNMTASLPSLHLAQLAHPDQFLTNKTFTGQVVLLNIWASWCYLCKVENPLLLRIAQTFHVPIYGINFKDGSNDAKAWLQKNGDPYVSVGLDNSGLSAKSLGVYGTPQTFLIDKTGMIRYQHIGALTEAEWITVLWPLVQEYNRQ